MTNEIRFVILAVASLICSGSAFANFEFLKAAYLGDVAVVKAIVPSKKGQDILRQDGPQALWDALGCQDSLYNHHSEVAQFLIDSGVKPDSWEDIIYGTPLMRSVGRRCYSVTEILLKAGADVRKTKNGHTALWLAADRAFCKEVELLIKYNSEINFENEGWTPLMVASSLSDGAPCVSALLAAGASVDQRAALHDSIFRGTYTALTGAALYGNVEVINVLFAARKEYYRNHVEELVEARDVAQKKGFARAVEIITLFIESLS